MKNQFSGGNNHIFICGMTRSGKTYFATRALEQLSCGAIYINIQGTQLPQKFMQVYADQIGIDRVREALRAGDKLNLCFPRSWSMDHIMMIIEYLTHQLLKSGFDEHNYIYIAFDECQLLKGGAAEEVRLAATRGLFLGCRCVFITQRPALADLTLYTQSNEHYIFKLGPGEREYFKNKGIDYDKCFDIWSKRGPYSYVYFDGLNMEGGGPA